MFSNNHIPDRVSEIMKRNNELLEEKRALERECASWRGVFHDILEQRAAYWVASRIGEKYMDRKERAMRLLEEAVELAQAEGILQNEVIRQVAHVYERPEGKPEQEAGGIAVTLLAWCASTGNQLIPIACKELDRIEAKPLEEIRGSMARKEDADLVRAV